MKFVGADLHTSAKSLIFCVCISPSELGLRRIKIITLASREEEDDDAVVKKNYIFQDGVFSGICNAMCIGPTPAVAAKVTS